MASTATRISRPWPASAPAGRSPAPPPPDAAGGTVLSGPVLFRTVPSGPAPPAAPQEREFKALRSRSAERLDLAPAVRLAVRADTVRPLRLVADRAEVHARRFEPVRGPALVAARLGGLLLGDCHERLRSIRAGLELISQLRQLRPAWVGLVLLLLVRLAVQVAAAGRAEAGALRLAEDLVREGEDDGVARPGGEVEAVVGDI